MASYRAFLFPGSAVSGDRLILDGRESHHLVRVLRAQLDDSVTVLDGVGTCYTGHICRVDGKALEVEVEAVDRAERSACALTLLQSIPKGKSMDLILRMATEIGATAVQPIFTNQGEVQIKGERLASKVEKWRVTMIEACKQCGVAHLPELRQPVALGDWLDGYRPEPDRLGVVASLEAGSRPLYERLVAAKAGTLKEVLIAVGPEGDFTLGEYAALAAADFKAVRLGRHVLRSETAAAYALSVVDQFSSAHALSSAETPQRSGQI